MDENREDEENDHENQWTDCSSDSKQTDEADLREIDSSKKLLQGTGVYKTLGIDLRISDEEDIVSEGEIEE